MRDLIYVVLLFRYLFIYLFILFIDFHLGILFTYRSILLTTMID